MREGRGSLLLNVFVALPGSFHWLLCSLESKYYYVGQLLRDNVKRSIKEHHPPSFSPIFAFGLFLVLSLVASAG